MQIDIQSVSIQEKSILQNLFQLYTYEFSKFIPAIRLNPDGLYDLFQLEYYWTIPHIHAYFIKVDLELAGFVLVKSNQTSTTHFMEQFFVMRKFAGKGIGKKVAKRIFDMFPGKWTVVQVAKNYPAQAFWRSIISEYTNGFYQERYDHQRRSIQEFDTTKI